jgi:GNAT superfamily N-acetyltransferase
LRGMATDAHLRRTGIGAAVLQCAIDLAAERSPVRLFWCNARVPALAFYQRHGWQIASPQFEIPTAGPHHKMFWRPPVPSPLAGEG